MKTLGCSLPLSLLLAKMVIANVMSLNRMLIDMDLTRHPTSFTNLTVEKRMMVLYFLNTMAWSGR